MPLVSANCIELPVSELNAPPPADISLSGGPAKAPPIIKIMSGTANNAARPQRRISNGLFMAFPLLWSFVMRSLGHDNVLHRSELRVGPGMAGRINVWPVGKSIIIISKGSYPSRKD